MQSSEKPKSSRKNKHHEYIKLVNRVNELDIQRDMLQNEINAMDAQAYLKDFAKVKRTKKEGDENKDKSLKQVKIDFFWHQKPENFVAGLLNHAVESAWDIICSSHPELASKQSQTVVPLDRRVKVKAIYSNVFKKKIKEFLKEHYVIQAYLYCNRRVPKSTLYSWKEELTATKTVGKSGRKTPFRILEEELFLWFVKKRAQKIILSQNTIFTKALRLCKSILMDEEVTLSPEEKDAYVKFEGSNGWLHKFKGRYNIVSRFVTTKCQKNAEEMKIAVESYFKELNEMTDALNKPRVYNMDECCIFFELNRGQTLEVKGKKVVGAFSSGKDKERVTLLITASSDGHLLPPFILFKASKPRNKSFDDHPDQEEQVFKEKNIKELIKNHHIVTLRTYSGWNNKRIMKEHFIPYYKQHSSADSLLLLDNHGSHITDSVTQAFESNEIKYLHLAPCTTPICQPVDVEIGGTIKAKIKSYYEEWLLNSWEENDFFKYNEKKKKYTYKAPTRSLIIEWINRAYLETTRQTVINGNTLILNY